jgi:hypothetical protein
MIRDRRSGNERRGIKRIVVNIKVEWEGANGRQQGTINDLSRQGCFILCSGEVEDGEYVKVFLPLADKMKVQFWGEVVNHIYEIGFAVRFIELSGPQKEFLERLVKRIENK